MSEPISNREKWQKVLIQRRLANVQHWVEQLETSHDSATFVLENYDNLLRTLESALGDDSAFDFVYRLIRNIWPVVFGFADWERWQIYFNEALQISRRLQEVDKQGFFLERIAMVYIQRANYVEAEALLNEAIEIYHKLGNLEDYAQSLTRLIEAVYHLRNDLQESLALCQKAIQIGHRLQSDAVLGNAFNVQAFIYQNAREWRLCLESAQQAYEVFDRMNLPGRKTNALGWVVLAHTYLKEWEAVENIDSQLTEILVSTGNIESLATHKNRIGIAAFKQENYAIAELLWHEALNLHSQVGNQRSLAAIYNNLGKVYTKMREWEAARDFLGRAIEIYDEIEQLYNWANSMDNLADLYEAMGEMGQCCAVLATAVSRLNNVDQNTIIEKLQATLKQRVKDLTQNQYP
jgi:tetratricopeptide (TPR) repeat protein